MNKVLIISFAFPPKLAIGSQRPYRLSKYLPEFGWEAVILTIKRQGKLPAEVRVIETDYKDITRNIKTGRSVNNDNINTELKSNWSPLSIWKKHIVKFIKEIVRYPDDQKGWYKFALKAASQFLINEKVDAIISTSYPVTSHLVAKQLKKRFKIPWIADLRDLWTQNPYVEKSGLIRILETRLEVKTLSDADLIVTVTKPWIKTLKQLHRDKTVYCVTNGYDNEEYDKLDSNLSDKFTITYTGTLYNGKRDPSLLFSVIRQLINENKIDKNLIEVRFYSNNEAWLSETVKKYDLADIVHIYGYLPREEILKKQRESQILLLLLWDNKNEEGFCPGKLYEYFGARRPIIATGWHRSIVRELLEATNAGRFGESFHSLENILLVYYQEFMENGAVSWKSNSKINDYSYRAITKRYSEILNEVLLNRSDSLK